MIPTIANCIWENAKRKTPRVIGFFLLAKWFPYIVSQQPSMNMMHLPKSEEEAVLLLQDHGLVHTERSCQTCNKQMVLHRCKWRCRKCRGHISVRTGVHVRLVPRVEHHQILQAGAEDVRASCGGLEQLPSIFLFFFEKGVHPICEMPASMPSSTNSKRKLEVVGSLWRWMKACFPKEKAMLGGFCRNNGCLVEFAERPRSHSWSSWKIEVQRP